MMCYERDHHLFTNTKTDLTHSESVHNRLKNRLISINIIFKTYLVLVKENGLFDMLHLKGCDRD